jgi:hypothetical protein
MKRKLPLLFLATASPYRLADHSAVDVTGNRTEAVKDVDGRRASSASRSRGKLPDFRWIPSNLRFTLFA